MRQSAVASGPPKTGTSQRTDSSSTPSSCHGVPSTIWLVPVIPGAAGGPKGLILNPLDRYIFGHWLPQSQQTVHLLGASIGAWRMAAATLQAEGAFCMNAVLSKHSGLLFT